MALDFYIFDQSGQNPVTRYGLGDLVDITAATGPLPIPNTSSPCRIVRVVTTRTKAEVESYLEKGSTHRRAYYLDTTRMSAADLSYWNANRAIETPEATALGWVRRKTGQ